MSKRRALKVIASNEQPARPATTPSVPEDFDWPKLDGKKPAATALPNVVYFLKHDSVEVRFDEFSTRLETCMSDNEWREFDKRALLQIVHDMHEAGCLVREATVQSAVEHLGFQRTHHPVREYLEGLTWDGKPRLDKMLNTYVGAEDNALNRAMGAAWMIAAVRRIRVPGSKFDAILTLVGEQGAGKSSFFRLLATKEWFSDQLEIGADAKSVIEQTAGRWIIECAELSGMGSRDVEKVKAFASAQEDRARPAYGRVAQSVPRQFVLGASVNSREFLRDQTGNRRFWIVPVERLDEVALGRDRDQLWAEAAHREAANEAANIPSELWPEVETRNADFTVSDPIEERAFALFSVLPRDAIVVPSEIAQAVGIGEVSKQGGRTAQSIASGARKAGFENARGAAGGLLKAGTRHFRKRGVKTERPRLYVAIGDTGKLKPAPASRPH